MTEADDQSAERRPSETAIAIATYLSMVMPPKVPRSPRSAAVELPDSLMLAVPTRRISWSVSLYRTVPV